MPLYEYECTACQHRFEVIQKFSDRAIEACPVCGGAVDKLLSSPAIQFKGSGWYITDYARAGKKEEGAKPAAGDAASTSPTKGDSGGETAGESKADAKTESKAESKSDAKAPAAGSKPATPSA